MEFVKIDVREIITGTVLITTNRFVKSDGTAVMGRGVAKAIQEVVPEFPRLLGEALQQPKDLFVGLVKKSNIIDYGYFMVKPRYGNENDLVEHMKGKMSGNKVAGWAVKADIAIVEASLRYLELLLRANVLKYPIYLPYPAIGAGELSRDTVYPLLVKYLGDYDVNIVEKPEKG